MSKRAVYMFALYEGSLAEPGDRNPYKGKSLVLAKLWMRGYRRMLLVQIYSGPEMQPYLAARASDDAIGGPSR
ncbi:MAG: ribosome modulation factor [Mycobacterium sp.]